VSWLTRRLDHICAAAAGGVGGITLSQAQAFTNAYLQRLGGHIDEAARTVAQLRDGEILPWLGPAGREQAVNELSIRLETLETLRQRLVEAPELLRPLALLRHGDWAIARSAAEAFIPAVPLSPGALTWTLIGVVIAALVYDSCKVPFIAAGRLRRRRATQRESAQPPKKSGQARPAGADSAARKASTTRKAQ
jgi:hypothetical protein